MVAGTGLRSNDGIGGGATRVFGSGGMTGAGLTSSRQACRSAGDICDHRSAFFKNSCRSAGLIVANWVKDRRHCCRCPGESLS